MRTDVSIVMREWIALFEIVHPYISKNIIKRREIEHPLFPGMRHMGYFVDELPDHIREIAPHYMDLLQMQTELAFAFMLEHGLETEPGFYQPMLDDWREKNLHKLRDPERFTRQWSEDIVMMRFGSPEDRKRVAKEWYEAEARRKKQAEQLES